MDHSVNMSPQKTWRLISRFRFFVSFFHLINRPPNGTYQENNSCSYYNSINESPRFIASLIFFSASTAASSVSNV